MSMSSFRWSRCTSSSQTNVEWRISLSFFTFTINSISPNSSVRPFIGSLKWFPGRNFVRESCATMYTMTVYLVFG
ncbi:unnamed protein product [Haemonchus placei]|uniref:Secreted protein n=1 Tax=Haemonchus placei TaxID=6290 RepID=A0A0N4W3M2_HAEPC|nr:unnamed protein product [Haemonchus placei]